MWTREELKSAAKAQLSGYYWMAFLCSLVAGLIISVFSGGSSFFISFSTNISLNLGLTMNEPELARAFSDPEFSAIFLLIMMIMLFIGIVLTIVEVVYGALIGNIVTVGQVRFYLTAPYGERSIKTLFYGFQQGRWKKIVKSMFLTNLSIWLWSLLFVIPGVIKQLEYSMVPYLISESPDLTAADAKRISSEMTNGHKFDIFVLELSFLGWILLGALLFGFGVYFVTPYISATYAQLYFRLRDNYQHTSHTQQNGL